MAKSDRTKKLNVDHFEWPEPMIPPVNPRKSKSKKPKSKKTKIKPGFGEERVPSDSWPFWKPKYIGVRKGDRVGYRSLGEVNPGTPPTGIVGAGQPPVGAMPTPAVAQKRPPSVKKQPSQEEMMAKKIDATNKIAAAKAEDAKVAQRKSLGQPQGQPQGKPPGPPGQPPAPLGMPPGPPGMQKPPVLSRKGDSIKPQGYKKGGKVYSNVCRPASNYSA